MNSEKTEDPWIEWNGGECPVEADALVEVRWRDGTIDDAESASFWTWVHCEDDPTSDIIAYRVVKP